MQQAAFDAEAIPAIYEAIEATSAHPIFQQLRERRYRGWNVTTPLKEQAVACVDHLSTSAAGANAVNVVRRDDGELVGHNTDGEGFVRALEELWPGSVGASLLILGSGPTARAIAWALQAAGSTRLFCWSRNQSKAAALAPAPRGTIDLVVCALPPAAEVAPEVLKLADSAEMVFDLNYGAARSPLASVAAPKRTDGLPLLLHQGILSFEWWTGRAAPVAVMRDAIRQGSAGR